MARPLKENADYFSHDNGMRNDDKILAIRRKYKHTWYAIWCFLLEKLCATKKFKLHYNDMNLELRAGDFDIETDLLKEIIEYMIKINLLKIEWWHDYDDLFIFSSTMITRFWGLVAKRNRDKDRLSSARIQWKWVVVSESTQSKVKESKVKKRKENNNIFRKPSVEEIKTYCLERKNKINAQKFLDYYESKWRMIWKNKMKDWKACVRTREWNEITKQSTGWRVLPNVNEVNHF